MKKFVTFMVCGVLAVSMVFAGCSPKGKTAEKEKKYPEKQIEITVPLAAGGGTDAISRAFAEQLTKEWGQPVIVVNKPGGNGLIGTQEAMAAKPDGYTILANTPTNTSLYQATTAKPVVKIEDHTFLTGLGSLPYALIVKADAPWKDLKEFSDWALKNPDQLTWGSSGVAATASFVINEWYQNIGGDISKTKMVSTTGGGDALTKIAGGHIVLYPSVVSQALPLIDAGKIKALAVSSPQRDPKLPNVPTFKEQGFKDLSSGNWVAYSAPKGTPEYIVKKWDETFKKMLNDKEFLAKLEKLKLDASYSSTADVNKQIQAEVKTFMEIADKLGIRK